MQAGPLLCSFVTEVCRFVNSPSRTGVGSS